jgi:hypothetical protein
MAAPRQGLPVRLDRAPQRGAAFAITRASRRARTRSIGSRSRARGSSLIFDHPPAVAPSPRRQPHRTRRRRTCSRDAPTRASPARWWPRNSWPHLCRRAADQKRESSQSKKHFNMTQLLPSLSGVALYQASHGGVRSSRTDRGAQVAPPAGATVPPWLPAKSARRRWSRGDSTRTKYGLFPSLQHVR